MNILFSAISGFNLYTYDETPYTLFGVPKQTVKHLKNNKLYFLEELSDDLLKNRDLSTYKKYIAYPPVTRSFVWPVDIVSIKKGDDNNTSCRYAMVFPCKKLPKMLPLQYFLQQRGCREELDDETVNLILNMLEAFTHFYNLGYAHHEFSENTVFYSVNDKKVYSNFSFSAQLSPNKNDISVIVNPGRVMKEYADTFFYTSNSKNMMDMRSDCYTIAVLLFRIIIGRLPYHGSAMDEIPNSLETEHIEWLEEYHKRHIFIFDPINKLNHIGEFAEEFACTKMWEALPKEIRDMFINLFDEQNALREKPELNFYTPGEWLAVFSKYYTSSEGGRAV